MEIRQGDIFWIDAGKPLTEFWKALNLREVDEEIES